MEICYLFEPELAENMAKVLLDKQPTILGFDVECSDNRVSLISLCHLETKYKIYLFQIKNTSVPNSLIKILSNDNIIKTGVGTKCDAARLTSIGIKLEGCLELSQLAAIKRYPLGLKELYSAVFPDLPSLPKVNHLGVDWNQKLSAELIDYAACDARAGLQIALKLLQAECPVSVDVSFDDNFIIWLKQQLQQPRSLSNLINLSTNSYKLWAKYAREDRVKIAYKHLTNLPANCGIYYKPLTEIFSLVPFPSKTLTSFYPLSSPDLKLIIGIEVVSAINFLYNSSPTFASILNLEVRKEIIENSLEEAIKKEIIKKENGKIIKN